ncbi:cytochrome c-type biogenesis protein CcmH, partial [Micromonospora yasonensis]|nr:cytochrome c-type biogenesis protein CcmH [Micromonospora yasonensis]
MIVNCLGVLAAVPALPPAAPRAVAAPAQPAPAAPAAPAQRATPIPTGVPAAPPAVAPTKPPPVQMAKPPVTLAMDVAGTPAPGYRILVRNGGTSMVETTVRQELPTGARATTVTGGGRASIPIGSSGVNEVTWRLRLPPHSTTALHTALSTTPATGRSVTAPACVYGTDGTRPYDCATATWTGPGAAPTTAKVTAAPVWRRPPLLLAGPVAALVVAGSGLWWWQRRRRPGATASGPRTARAGIPAAPGGAGGPADRGTVYPRPAMPAVAGRRR